MSTEAVQSQAIAVSDLEARIREIDAEINALTTEREMIQKIVKRHAKPLSVKANWKEQARPKGPGPREGIIGLLGKQRDLTATQVAEALELRIASKAKDKKNVIRTTLAKMVTEGVIARSSEGKHRLAGDDSATASTP